MTATFMHEVLELYDLKLAKIIDVVQTQVPMIEIKDRSMDIAFLLEDDTIAHFEFECSEPTVQDQIRYGHYDFELYNQRMKKIHRIVVYGAGIKGRLDPLDIGSIKQFQTVIYLEEHFNGDQVFSEIKEIILGGKAIEKLDKLRIMLLPMMLCLLHNGDIFWQSLECS